MEPGRLVLMILQEKLEVLFLGRKGLLISIEKFLEFLESS